MRNNDILKIEEDVIEYVCSQYAELREMISQCEELLDSNPSKIFLQKKYRELKDFAKSMEKESSKLPQVNIVTAFWHPCLQDICFQSLNLAATNASISKIEEAICNAQSYVDYYKDGFVKANSR